MKTTGKLWEEFGREIERAERDNVDPGIIGGWTTGGVYYYARKYSDGSYELSSEPDGKRIFLVKIY